MTATPRPGVAPRHRAVLLLVLLAGGIAGVSRPCLRALPFGWLLEIAVAAVFLASASLHDHVRDGGRRLRAGGAGGGRRAVSMIVGRDPQTSTGPGWPRRDRKRCGELFRRRVRAGLLVRAVRPPGILVYKAVNTATA